MKKRLFLIFTIYLLLSIALASLRGGYVTILGITGFSLSSIIGFILLGIGTVWCIMKYGTIIKPIYIILAVWLGVSLLEMIFRIRNFSSSLISLPNMIIWWMGILVGYIYTLTRNMLIRVFMVVIPLCVVLWCIGPGYRLFLHKLNYGTYNGQTMEKINMPIVFSNQNNENIDISIFKGKYVILNFWNSYCGVCFEEFPDVQKFFNQIKNNKNVLFYSIHCAYTDKGENFKTGYSILQNEGYSFPCLSLSINGTIIKALNIKVYPTMLIIDKESRIVHKGNIESVERIMSRLRCFSD